MPVDDGSRPLLERVEEVEQEVESGVAVVIRSIVAVLAWIVFATLVVGGIVIGSGLSWLTMIISPIAVSIWALIHYFCSSQNENAAVATSEPNLQQNAELSTAEPNAQQEVIT